MNIAGRIYRCVIHTIGILTFDYFQFLIKIFIYLNYSLALIGFGIKAAVTIV
jgi:hypothetical protein